MHLRDLGDQRSPRTNGDLSRAIDSRRIIFRPILFRSDVRINPFDFSLAGREESDTDDQLLGDTDLDGPSPEMERLGVRWDPSDPCSLQSRLEAGHDSLQQVSHDSFFDDRKKRNGWETKTWKRKEKEEEGGAIFWCRKIEVSISIERRASIFRR